jgi:hypothetical protein
MWNHEMGPRARSTSKRRSNPERGRDGGGRTPGGFIVNRRFRRGTGPRAAVGHFPRISRGSRLARPLLCTPVSDGTHFTRRNEMTKFTNALAIALATMLTASAAHAATLQDAQAPRAAAVQAPRGDERVEAPRDRSQDIQAPRGHDTQSPR